MSHPALRVGDTIEERFEIERQVASGGMGRVYRARDRRTGQPVAVKLLAYQDPRARERFLYEAVVLAEIQHPGIVRYVAHGTAATGEPYLVMEWLDGEDLAHHLLRLRRQAAAATPPATPAPPTTPLILSITTESTAELGPPTLVDPPVLPTPGPIIPPSARVPVAQALQLGRRLASAVAELHHRGIVHRDIKPGNLFLRNGSFDHVKLLDFGTVRHQLVSERMTEPGRLIGTPNYMAPEQARANGDIGPATDVWAIGCVLYECLTGAKAFSGSDLLVVLTRILLEEPVPIRVLRPEVPQALADLVTRTLAKAPARRLPDAHALAQALEALGRASAIMDAVDPSSLDLTLHSPISITAAEARVTCMLFASDGRSREERADQRLAVAVAPTGAALQRLADGTLLATIPEPRAPIDQAARIARAALALRAAAPTMAMVLATGRAEGPRQMPLDQVVSQAARALHQVGPGKIQADVLTASLLDPRFHLSREAESAYLESERQHEATRTLLGKPTRWVGRQRELANLLAIFDECREEETARVVLVTATAGMGKSRLRYELEQALRQRGDDYEVLRGQGDVVSAGSPFVMIAPAIRRLAGIRDGEPLEERRRRLYLRLAETVPHAELERIAVFLGELTGVPFPDEANPSLRAARKDPLLLGQLMQAAWVDWLRAECSHRPVLLLLEDLHWGDRPSVQYVDSALHGLADARLMVLAMARPEVHTVFPKLWSQRGVHELPLHALSRKASLNLVHDVLGPGVSEEVASAVVERANGNAFYLEELIRVVAAGDSGEGADQLPDTILGMVQSRLDTLGAEAKRILRAGSIFGKSFWQGGVEALLGPGGAYGVSEWLDDLVAREVISRQPESRVPGDLEYKFRHALVRDGAYAMLTEEDRRLGHALAGAWLEQAGEQDGLVLAEHFMRGGDPERAIPCFHRAAAQALEGNDLAAVVSRAERAVQAGAQGAMLGALRALQSVASYWLSNYAAGRRHGCEAAELLPAGSAEWFVALGSAIVSSARLSDFARVDELFTLAMQVQCAPDAEAEQLVCLCRGTFQLVFNGRAARADQILPRIAALADQAGELDALTTAQVNHVQGLRALHRGDLDGFIRHLEALLAAFERAGDTRNLLLERSTHAWFWAEIGFYEHAAELCERNLALCNQRGIRQAITYAKVNLGYILSYCEGRQDEARRVLNESIDECREVGNARLEGWARGHLTWVEHQAGAHAAEEREAARAVELLAASPGLQGWALATRARALLALGEPAEALVQARKAMSMLEQLGGLLQGESLPPLVLAQALDALGQHEARAAAIANAGLRIERRAACLSQPEWQQRFMTIPEHQLTFELARAWGVLES